jgi:hypothetical protein
VLSDMGLEVDVGDAHGAAHKAYAQMHATAAKLKEQASKRAA